MEAIPEISYPIVQGKTDDDYLHTTVEGTYNFAGSIFLESDNSRDFTDGNSIIYGHNMKDTSMFGRLKWLMTDGVYQNSLYFWVLTPDYNLRYQIFNMAYVISGSDPYIIYPADSVDFPAFAQMCASLSEVALPQHDFTKKDKIVTLSTCWDAYGSGRFIAQGYLDPWQEIIPKEQNMEDANEELNVDNIGQNEFSDENNN